MDITQKVVVSVFIIIIVAVGIVACAPPVDTGAALVVGNQTKVYFDNGTLKVERVGGLNISRIVDSKYDIVCIATENAISCVRADAGGL